MSYEGYREYQCSCGEIDAMDAYGPEPTACRKCGGRWVKIRSIDQTNGHDVYPWRDVEYRQEFDDYVSRRDDINEIVSRRFGPGFAKPCNYPNVVKCTYWECQYENRCVGLRNPGSPAPLEYLAAIARYHHRGSDE